jgi:NDP-sugar pyrophosphorylase family protein
VFQGVEGEEVPEEVQENSDVEEDREEKMEEKSERKHYDGASSNNEERDVGGRIYLLVDRMNGDSVVLMKLDICSHFRVYGLCDNHVDREIMTCFASVR